ncbi:MAG: hypothetical protein U0Y68_08160 [Blastocatellia bacterium]
MNEISSTALQVVLDDTKNLPAGYNEEQYIQDEFELHGLHAQADAIQRRITQLNTRRVLFASCPKDKNANAHSWDNYEHHTFQLCKMQPARDSSRQCRVY